MEIRYSDSSLLADIVFIALIAIHIIFAAVWLGAGLLFTMVIVPTLKKVEPGSRAEFLIFALARYVRLVIVSSSVGVLAGVALFAYFSRISGSLPPAKFDLIAPGAILGLVAYLLVLGLVYPTSKKLVYALKSKTSENETPYHQIPRLQGRLRASASLAVLLLVATLFLMVFGTNI